VKEVEDKPGWHGKALDNPDEAIAELGGVRNIVVEVAKPDRHAEPHRFETSGPLELPRWDEGEEVATRRAYGDALAALGSARGDDGPSQMALEDLAMMRAVHGSTVLYPCDANQTATLVEQMADREGIIFLRTTRAATPVLYGADEEFPIGGSRVVREGDDLAI